MSRDIDVIIARVYAKHPDAVVAQLKVSHPGVDDDGVWTFHLPTHPKGIQIESSTGCVPFLVETDDMTSSSEAHSAGCIEDVVLAVTTYFSRSNQK
jgi:hypothetical protein